MNIQNSANSQLTHLIGLQDNPIKHAVLIEERSGYCVFTIGDAMDLDRLENFASNVAESIKPKQIKHHE
jgi:hypothetical protein